MHSRICLGALILGLVGCGVFGADSSDPGGGTPSVTPDGGLPMGAPPATVGTPDNNELTNEFGVFVATTGSADGDGTKEHPFASIGAGIERVKDLKLRVYVCAGTYNESLTLVDAVSVIGALTCDGGAWHTGGARTVLAAPTSPAIRAKNIVSTTRFDGFDVSAPVGTAMSPSSIALIAENASKLTVANTKLTSAKAFDGADGADGTQLTLAATAKGTDGLASAGPALADPIKPIPYQGGTAGGVGSCAGAAGHDGESGGAGGNGATEHCGAAVVMGNTIYLWQVYGADVRTDAVPHSGAAGGAGTDGVSAAAIGALTPAGYTPVAGTAGTDGAPGKGGSGGNGGPLYGASGVAADNNKYHFGAAGAGGGAGGCPGLAGTFGGGGGASIAALVFASPGLAFTTTELVAGAGGAGGKGAFGGQPTAGGAPGAIKAGATAASAGGAGGRAGFSGNGAGGPSVALAHTGGEIVVAQDTHLTAGTAGAGVVERSRTDSVGNKVTIPASASGPATPTLAF